MSATAGTSSKTYDCGDRKIELSEPKDGVMDARIEAFAVEISVRERSGTVPPMFSVDVVGLASTSASELLEALDAACRIVARHHEVLKAPSEGALAKQLGEFYDSL